MFVSLTPRDGVRHMKIFSSTLTVILLLFSPVVYACQPGSYISEEGVRLELLQGYSVIVLNEQQEELYLGRIESYPNEDFSMFQVIADEQSEGKNATIHLGGDCKYIKMYWWSGERHKSDFYKYNFERNA